MRNGELRNAAVQYGAGELRIGLHVLKACIGDIKPHSPHPVRCRPFTGQGRALGVGALHGKFRPEPVSRKLYGKARLRFAQ